MTKDAPDWDRAGRAVDKRIAELGLYKASAAKRAGIDTSSLWRVRRGDAHKVSPALRRKVDAALLWPAGTIDRVANDPSYRPPSAALTDQQRLASLEQRLEELEERQEEWDSKLDEILRQLGA